MAWESISIEEVTGPDDQRWEVDLLTGKQRFVSPEGEELPAGVAGARQRGVKASAYRDGDFQFAIVAWVASPGVDAAKIAVMNEARRGIEKGDWEPGEHKTEMSAVVDPR